MLEQVKLLASRRAKDIDYLTHKAKQARILSFTGSERGTSSQCPRWGISTNPKVGFGTARSVGSRATVILLVRSICISWHLVSKWSFLVPSRIYVLVYPGQVVVGPTRPN